MQNLIEEIQRSANLLKTPQHQMSLRQFFQAIRIFNKNSFPEVFNDNELNKLKYIEHILTANRLLHINAQQLNFSESNIPWSEITTQVNTHTSILYPSPAMMAVLYCLVNDTYSLSGNYKIYQNGPVENIFGIFFTSKNQLYTPDGYIGSIEVLQKEGLL